MNPNGNKESIHRLYPLSAKNNPANNANYHTALHFSPSLRQEIAQAFLSKHRQGDSYSENSGELPDNIMLTEIGKAQVAARELRMQLDILSESCMDSKAPIILVRDSCFTNHLLEKRLSEILEEDYTRLVNVVEVDFTNPSSLDVLNAHSIPNHSIIILGGSFSDTYEIHPKVYTSEFAKILRATQSNLPDKKNLRFLGVCFGQQFMANNLGISLVHTPNIVATHKGVAQFMPSRCTVEPLNTVPRVYSRLLQGVVNGGSPKNGQDTNSERKQNTQTSRTANAQLSGIEDIKNEFTGVFTRTGHVSFNLLPNSQGYNDPIVPLIRNPLTDEIVGWGIKSGRVLGVQFHPEIGGDDIPVVIDELRNILPILERDYGKEVRGILNNFEGSEDTLFPIGYQFYTYALKGFTEDILSSVNIENLHSEGDEQAIGFGESSTKLIEMIQSRLNTMLGKKDPRFKEGGDFKNLSKQHMLAKLDILGKLILNARIDWKVNRGILEASETLGVRNLSALIKEHQEALVERGLLNGAYIFRDWGAGNGTLLMELYKSLPQRDIVFYGVGDNVYYDLYQALKLSPQYTEFPEEVLILFTQKVIANYNEIRMRRKADSDGLQSEYIDTKILIGEVEAPLMRDIQEAINNVELQEGDIIYMSSMFADKTCMFSEENARILSDEAREYLRTQKNHLNRLKSSLGENFYDFFKGFFERIFVSDFMNFSVGCKTLEKATMQVAIRSTSHIDSEEFAQGILDYTQKFCKNGSIFLENGIHRSYTSIPRLNELARSLHKAGGNFRARLIYDPKTNYFCSAVIEKAPFQEDGFIEKHLADGMILVSLEEAVESTFFQCEIYLRELIIATFRDFKVFFHFNHNIIEALKKIVQHLEDNNSVAVKEEIISLINTISTHFNTTEGRNYQIITMEDLELFNPPGSKSINDIFKHGVLEFPWFNHEAKRRY